MIKLPFGLAQARVGFRRATFRKHPMGAAYVDAGLVVIASNVQKTHPLSKEYESRWEWLHAEHNLLRNISNASKGIVYVYRETKDGHLAMSRPCDGCRRLLLDRGVKKVIYTIQDSWATERI